MERGASVAFGAVERLWIVRWLREHPRGADAILAGVLAAMSVTIHLVGTGFGDVLELQDPTWWSVPLVLAASVPVAWRRSAPTLTAYVIVIAQSVMELARVEGTGWLPLIVAVYSVGAHSDHPRRPVASGGLLVAIGTLLVSGVVLDEIGIGTVLGTVAVVVAALLFGDNVRRRRQHLDDLAERAERAEREQELRARERVRDERTRIARELHDVVAHSVSVMIIQAGAARRSLPERPDDSVAMLHEIEGSGRRAMEELRRVLGVLRAEADEHDEPAPLGPQPGIDDLPALVADDPDLPVALSIDPDVHGLPQGVAVSVYRLVQEALTNIRRHAGPVDRVEVTLAVVDGLLDVVIDDDGRGASVDHDTPDGFGIAGMHERVQALGGTVTAGARRGGGWRVHARVPVGRPAGRTAGRPSGRGVPA